MASWRTSPSGVPSASEDGRKIARQQLRPLRFRDSVGPCWLLLIIIIIPAGQKGVAVARSVMSRQSIRVAEDRRPMGQRRPAASAGSAASARRSSGPACMCSHRRLAGRACRCRRRDRPSPPTSIRGQEVAAAALGRREGSKRARCNERAIGRVDQSTPSLGIAASYAPHRGSPVTTCRLPRRTKGRDRCADVTHQTARIIRVAAVGRRWRPSSGGRSLVWSVGWCGALHQTVTSTRLRGRCMFARCAETPAIKSLGPTK